MTQAIDLEKLSDTAKAVAGAWFGMMSPGKGDLTFELREGRPTDEALDALSELVRAGVASVAPFNQYGGLVYRPLVDCRPAFKWLLANEANPAAKIVLIQSVAGENEARAVQKRALKARTQSPAGA
jgi:hypothetical protein